MAETLQERHKNDLDGGCILSGQEEPCDLAIVSALYSSVNMEMEVTLWKEQAGRVWINDDDEKDMTARRLTGGKKYRAKGYRSKDYRKKIR